MILTVAVAFGDKARNRPTRCNGRTGGEGSTVSIISRISLDNHYLDAAILLLVRGGLVSGDRACGPHADALDQRSLYASGDQVSSDGHRTVGRQVQVVRPEFLGFLDRVGVGMPVNANVLTRVVGQYT